MSSVIKRKDFGKNYYLILMNRKAIIFGIKSYKLTPKEKSLLKRTKPWGIILFSRNIKDITQLKSLILSIQEIFKDKKYPILIDQEGGKVSRLNNIIDLSIFSQEAFGNLFKKNKKLFYDIFKIYVDNVCEILKTTGININTVPVLDIRNRHAHKIIGNRSFSSNPQIVLKLGKYCRIIYEKNKVATVIKHIPGHGKANADSHFRTPVVKSRINQLKKKDFKPFKDSKSFFAMTAHVIYSSYDSLNTATHSEYIITNVIRKYLNFKGILISDDISMKALKPNLENNAINAINSGCNLVLHCNGNISEMLRLAKVIPKIDNFTKKKTSLFYKFLG